MRKAVIFGLGKFGVAVAEHLYGEGVEVLAIDRSLKLVEGIEERVSAAVACDATVRANLEAYDIGGMDAAVVAIGTHFEASVLITLHCRELGVGRIIAKALNPLQQRILTEVGAHQVILPEEEMGRRLAEHLLNESLVDFVELPDGYSLRRVAVPDKWIGQSLAQLRLLGTERLNLIQIVRQGPDAAGKAATGRERIPLPHGETVLRVGDLVDVIGPDEALAKLA